MRQEARSGRPGTQTLSNPLDAGRNFIRFKDALPVRPHQGRHPKLDRLIASVGKEAFALLEDYRCEHVDVAEQKIPGCLLGGTPRFTTSSMASRITTSSVAQTVSERPGSSSAICSNVTRWERITGAQITRAICSPRAYALSGPLHQRADDMLFGRNAAESNRAWRRDRSRR